MIVEIRFQYFSYCFESRTGGKSPPWEGTFEPKAKRGWVITVTTQQILPKTLTNKHKIITPVEGDPTKLNTSVPPGATLIWYLPAASVEVPLVVPLTATLTPESGSRSSLVTLPVISFRF